ncbi:MAG: sugar transferase [Bacteroidetes bacterium]|nr:sugar transferase [Bacteroidota bacterium]
MKRVFDVFVSCIILLLLFPFFLLIALFIFIDSGSPIFYRQTRVGLNNIDFQLFKFRTMHTHADKLGLLTVGGRDPRITKVGYFLRKYKLDELPQFMNVLQGNMSIVGPRPEVRKYVNMYSSEQLKVLSVKPGITDESSIKFSNESDLLASAENPEEYYIQVLLPQKVEQGINYSKNATIRNDIRIIIYTFLKIIKQR